MKEHQAIAAVTTTLQQLLGAVGPDGSGIGTENILFGSPGSFDTPPNGKLGLFLFRTELNAAWRNLDVPGKVKPGETGYPPLALDLFYLLTAYDEDQTSPDSHALLGRAMSILHDKPLLNGGQITYGDGSDKYTHDQVETIRITPHSMSLETMTGLWNSFKKDYRNSTAYQVSVVLIESTRPTKTPLPVRRRGPEEEGAEEEAAGAATPEGIDTLPDILPPLPTIEKISPAGGQPSLEFGTTFTIKGHHFTPETTDSESGVKEEVVILFRHPYLEINDDGTTADPPSLSGEKAVTKLRATKIEVTLPQDNSAFKVPPGPCFVSVGYRKPRTTKIRRSSGEFPTSVAATIRDVQGCKKGKRAVVAVRFVPAVRLEYELREAPERIRRPQISLLLGSEQIPFNNIRLAEIFEGPSSVNIGGIESDVPIDKEAPTQVLLFVADEIPPPNTFVRLRIDGTDSLLIEDRNRKPPRLRTGSQVTISDECRES